MSTGTDALLHWCQRYGNKYPGVDIKNFTTSWSSGLAFCAILHAFKPELIPFESLKATSAQERLKNFALAFDTAEDLGIPKLMDPEDMMISIPDRLSVITYVSQYYHFFRDQFAIGSVPSSPAPKIEVDFEMALKDWADEAMSKAKKQVQSTAIKERTASLMGSSSPRSPSSSSSAGPCARCGKPLSGQTVQAPGGEYHPECFGCSGCGKKMTGSCLNVAGKPYCEPCGRKAFILNRGKLNCLLLVVSRSQFLRSNIASM